jgi:hypothetical protein
LEFHSTSESPWHPNNSTAGNLPFSKPTPPPQGRTIHDRSRIIQRHLPESVENISPNGETATSLVLQYPITYTILLAIGIAHVFRRRRSRSPLTYRVLVEQKQWYRWWISAFSLPTDETEDTASTVLPRTRRDHGATFLPWMHGAWRRLWSMVRHRQHRNALEGIEELFGSVEYRHTQQFALLYIEYLVWSCRGLEVYYRRPNSDEGEEDFGGGGDAFTYLRVWLGLGLCAALSDLIMIYWLLLVSSEVHRVLLQRAIQRNNYSRPEEGVAIPAVAQRSDEDTSASVAASDPVFEHLRTLREWDARLQTQRLTINVVKLVSALLMVHRIRLSNVPIYPVPFLTSWMGPNVSYASSLLILFRILSLEPSRSPSLSLEQRDASSAVLRTMIHGTFLGWAWSHYLEFVASAYWGNALLLVGIVGTVLSLQAHSPMPCLPPVGCNARGRPLIYDAAAQRWLSDSDDDENDDDWDLGDARSGGDDGRTSSDDDDDDFLDEMAQLIVPGGGVDSSNVRSRRTATLLPGD